MNSQIIQRTIIFLGLLMVPFLSFTQKTTIISGKILDAKTKESMLYVNVQLDNSGIGTTSDVDGNFYIETDKEVKNLKVSYIGYNTKNIPIELGKKNVFTIELEEESIILGQVVIKNEKYSNKNNPAVELIRKIIDNKDKNRKSGFNFYNYNKHEKVEFAINDVTEKMKNNLLFRGIKFIFENVDTNKINGKVNLPIFLKENISDVYYRKEPKSQKEYIRAEKLTNIQELFNAAGINNLVDNMYQNIDFYDNNIMLLTNSFVSPLSPIAPSIYRFYIQDTTVVDGTSMIHLYFAPRTKSDLAFIGHMWVTNDTTYAVRKIDAGVQKDINLNWVRELQLAQKYDWVTSVDAKGNKVNEGLMLSEDNLLIDFGVTQSDDARSILGRKTVTYKDIHVNTPLHDSLFDISSRVYRTPEALTRTEEYWVEHRHDTLSRVQQGIYKTIDSLNNYKPFRRTIRIAKLILEGYTSFGGFDLGPTNTFYSFNPIEGFRARIGGRTNIKFSQSIMLEGYGAYGFKDKKWKGYGAFRYNFGHDRPLRFPYNQLKIWYQDDIKIPGQELQFIQEDNILLSFKRGPNDKMLYTATIGAEYFKEHENGFSYSIHAKNTKQRPAGILLFDYLDKDEKLLRNEIINSELGLMLRYAPNEKFYEGATYRTPILNQYPIFELRYALGVKGSSMGEYNYNKISARIKKVFYLAPFGYSELSLEGGKLFGQVPYPLLTIHRANQTYAYQLESYNLMNFLEFVSDKFAAVNYHHNFQGVFLGRVPLIKKLKWREVITFKSLWGGLSDSNKPNADNNLLLFPVDENGRTVTNTLDKKPYIEASVGISNIFKVIRVDYVRRLTYTDLPDVSKWGIRTRVKFEF